MWNSFSRWWRSMNTWEGHLHRTSWSASVAELLQVLMLGQRTCRWTCQDQRGGKSCFCWSSGCITIWWKSLAKSSVKKYWDPTWASKFSASATDWHSNACSQNICGVFYLSFSPYYRSNLSLMMILARKLLKCSLTILYWVNRIEWYGWMTGTSNLFLPLLQLSNQSSP